MIRVGVAGVGGFAGAHHAALEALEREGECKVLATCDPSPERLAEAAERYGFAARGVAAYPSLDAMLSAHRLDVVTLPTPLPLHAAQHRAVVKSGAACYLEKPPSLWWPEYTAMTSADVEGRIPTQVGFNFVGDPMRRALKARILSGELGTLQGATLAAVWPRDRGYFRRNDWGGRLRVDGRWVLDSCMGNAIAHYAQNLLFWCGLRGEDAFADVTSARAKLYRAHDIESYDTVFVSAELEGGAWIRIAETHTGSERNFEIETIHLDHAVVTFDSWRSATIRHRDGRSERIESAVKDQHEMLMFNLRTYFDCVRGVMSRPVIRLEDCRGFVALCDLALLSSGAIEDFSAERIHWDERAGKVNVRGLEDELLAFAEQGGWPNGALPRQASSSELDSIADRMPPLFPPS